MPSEYYAEETFSGPMRQSARVYTGPILLAITGMMLGCFGMSATTSRSPNLSFKWLQRRVGFQFAAFSYFFTTNALYSHNGERWVTRDFGELGRSAFGRMLWDIEKRRQKREEAAPVTDGAAADRSK